MAVRQRAADADPLLGDGDAPLQQSAKTFDQHGGPIRLNPAMVAKALAQQDRGGRAAIGHSFDIHGVVFSFLRPYQQTKSSSLHGYIGARKRRRTRRNPDFNASTNKNFGLDHPSAP